MSDEEADSFLKPRKKKEAYKPSNHTPKRVLALLCMIVTIFSVLYMDAILAYRPHSVVRDDMINAFKFFGTEVMERYSADDEKRNLYDENKILKEELARLLAQHEQILEEIQALKSAKDMLVQENRELAEDNLALQNTLKMAAAVGIKPQNYTKFGGFSSRGEIERGTYLGAFLGTAYTPSKEECGNNRGITNSGQPIIPGISIAIDDDYWPYGTIFYIKGLGYAVAMDTGSAIKGEKRFDFAVFDKKFAKKLGTEYWEVYLIKRGDGRIRGLEF